MESKLLCFSFIIANNYINCMCTCYFGVSNIQVDMLKGINLFFIVQDVDLIISGCFVRILFVCCLGSLVRKEIQKLFITDRLVI